MCIIVRRCALLFKKVLHRRSSDHGGLSRITQLWRAMKRLPNVGTRTSKNTTRNKNAIGRLHRPSLEKSPRMPKV